jgi:hypothetical protein
MNCCHPASIFILRGAHKNGHEGLREALGDAGFAFNACRLLED